MMDKFNARVDQLTHKMKLSQTPVPGFIIGLSGSDSVLTYLILDQACKKMDMEDRLLAIHYVDERRPEGGWFNRQVIPWLRQRCRVPRSG